MVTVSLEEGGLGWAAEGEAFAREESAEDTPGKLGAHGWKNNVMYRNCDGKC
jgi:hypothetical protein